MVTLSTSHARVDAACVYKAWTCERVQTSTVAGRVISSDWSRRLLHSDLLLHCRRWNAAAPRRTARHGVGRAGDSEPTNDGPTGQPGRAVRRHGRRSVGRSVGRSVQYWRDKSLRRAAALHGATQPVSEASERRSQQLRPPPVVVVVVVCLPPPTDDRHPPPSWRLEAAAAASAWKPGLAGALSLSLYINSLPQYTRRSSTSSCSLPSFYSCSTSDCQSSAEQKLVD